MMFGEKTSLIICISLGDFFIIFLYMKALKGLPYCPLHSISDNFLPPFEDHFYQAKMKLFNKAYFFVNVNNNLC